MSVIKEILQSKPKPKEKVSALTEVIVMNEVSAKDFIEFFKSASDVEKGYCAEVMKHVSKETPEFLAPFIDDLIGYINYDAPKVKWGIPEAIGNLSQKYPKEVELAIPKLLLNTKDPQSTVIRWCAAYGLTEIAKNNPNTREQLLPIFSEISLSEKNNGVRNLYVKALKVIEKGE